MNVTSSPIAATDRPAIEPIITASTMMLDSLARTMARRRWGTSRGGINKGMSTIEFKFGNHLDVSQQSDGNKDQGRVAFYNISLKDSASALAESFAAKNDYF